MHDVGELHAIEARERREDVVRHQAIEPQRRRAAGRQPDGYAVHIFGVGARQGGIDVTFYTRREELTVPAGIIRDDAADYFVLIRALMGPDVSRAPLPHPPSEAWATTFGGSFTP